MEEEKKKTTFFVCIFDISPRVFTQISIGRARWMWNLIPHPTRTRTTYFWWTLLPKNKKYLKKRDDDIIIMFFSSISYFWGREVCQKYALWVLVGCIIKFHIQRALPFRIWVNTQGDMSKIWTQKVLFSFLTSHFSRYFWFLGKRGSSKIWSMGTHWMHN